MVTLLLLVWRAKLVSFHSIGFPCERGGDLNRYQLELLARGFHSIGFPCERGVRDAGCRYRLRYSGFHSIGFPCERGDYHAICEIAEAYAFPFNWFPLREGSRFFYDLSWFA